MSGLPRPPACPRLSACLHPQPALSSCFALNLALLPQPYRPPIQPQTDCGGGSAACGSGGGSAAEAAAN